jgi:hypothetical protein
MKMYSGLAYLTTWDFKCEQDFEKSAKKLVP